MSFKKKKKMPPKRKREENWNEGEEIQKKKKKEEKMTEENKEENEKENKEKIEEKKEGDLSLQSLLKGLEKMRNFECAKPFLERTLKQITKEAFWVCVENGLKEEVEFFLSAGADVNLQNWVFDEVCDIGDCYDEQYFLFLYFV